MILYFVSPPGSALGGYAERTSLVFTFLANIAMQCLLIVSIYLGMLERAYDSSTIDDMKQFQATQPNKTHSICQRISWSWEQNDYKDLYAYTRPTFNFRASEIPGHWLAYLGMTVW